MATTSSSISSSSSTTSHNCRRLVGKVAIVTASTDGIGLAIAQRLAEEGAHVVVSSRKQANVDKAVELLKSKNLSVVGIVCHVAKQEDREKLIQTALTSFGGKKQIDILVSNAASSPTVGALIDISESAWEKLFEINVKAGFLLMKEAVPHMPKGSSIVFISSIGGFTPSPPISAYGVTKTTLFGLTRAAATELGSSGIRVNCVSPGIIKTRFSEILWKNPENIKKYNKTIPVGRLGESEDIAGPVAFLCSEDAAFMTGENIVVAGGVHARL